jgi:hypothetical protein
MKAVKKIAWMALLVGLLGPGAVAQEPLVPSQQAATLRMKELDRAQMPAADRALLDDAGGRLARAARVFGYGMQKPGWSCDEVMTPDTPAYLMLVCRMPQTKAEGASAFSALIARHGEEVYVVPVMYGGAAPWKTAANMKVSREIFNHVVPPRIAAEAVRATGDWMTLALTFTALAGNDSVVLAEPSTNLKWTMAPEPTILTRYGSSTRTIVFSDVSAADGVRIWRLTLNRQGRLTKAAVQIKPNMKPAIVSTKVPKARQLKHLPSRLSYAKPLPPVRQ